MGLFSSALSAITGSGIIDKGLDFAANNYMFNRQKHWQEEQLKNAHQWEVEDLKKAGLNPILSANTGASGASAPAWAGSEASSAADYVRQGRELERKDKEIKNETKKTKAEVKVAESIIENNRANTARTLALTPEEVKTHQFGRSGRIKKELGEEATEKAREIIEQTGYKTGEIAGSAETSAYKAKMKAKQSWNKNVEEYNKEHENDNEPSKWKNYNPLKIRQHYD